MKTFLTWLFLLAILVTVSKSVEAQTTSIENIKRTPANFEGDEVQVSGLVMQYVAGKGTTSYYLIKGDYGGIIRVNTSEPKPETNQKYMVTGIVYIDRSNGTPFISEKSKSSMQQNTTIQPQQTETLPQETKLEENPIIEEKDNTAIYALVVALVILVGLFFYFQTRKKATPKEFSSNENLGKPLTPQDPVIREPEPKFSSDSDYKTIKIVTSNPKTLKFIPGKLVITDGADKGKEFRIAGYPTPEGFIVSIGRKEVKGERAYAHIQLKEMTVSREQADLISKDGKLYVKNLSETNFTQLNGAELKLGQMVELSPNSSIRTGEVEFQYKL